MNGILGWRVWNFSALIGEEAHLDVAFCEYKNEEMLSTNQLNSTNDIKII